MLAPYVAAAAQELPVTLSDTRYFGQRLPELLDGLTAAGTCDGARRAGSDPPRPGGRVDRPRRGWVLGRVVEEDTGRVIGQVDWRRQIARFMRGRSISTRASSGG